MEKNIQLVDFGVSSSPVLHVSVLKEEAGASGENPAQDVAVRQQLMSHCATAMPAY